MSTAITTFPAVPSQLALPPAPAATYVPALTPARAVPPAPASEAKLPEHRHSAAPTQTTALTSAALSSSDVAYVDSLMGTLPAQKMEEILLKTGVPIPVNLGPNVDTIA